MIVGLYNWAASHRTGDAGAATLILISIKEPYMSTEFSFTSSVQNRRHGSHSLRHCSIERVLRSDHNNAAEGQRTLQVRTRVESVKTLYTDQILARAKLYLVMPWQNKILVHQMAYTAPGLMLT